MHWFVGLTATLTLRIMVMPLIAGLLVAAASVATSAQTEWPPNFLEDADLHDVHFVDSSNGWAVGDRGLILHSADGGHTWKTQSAPTDCSLRGVHFIDRQHGWVAGSGGMPYLNRSFGVVLRTTDGGKTWSKQKCDALPGLRTIQFLNSSVGFATGNATPMFVTGAVTTGDSGRSWNQVPASGRGDWQAAAFRLRGEPPTLRGIILRGTGRIVTCQDQTYRTSKTPTDHDRRMHDLCFADDNTAWAVGDGGTVWQSVDGGQRWNDLSDVVFGHSSEARQPCELAAIDAQDNHVWIADNTNFVLRRSTDNGKSWQAFSTSSTLPVARLQFINKTHGCAVGALGCVQITSDGGETWTTVRGCKRRLSMLGIFHQPQHIPFASIARMAGRDGARVRTLLVNSTPSPPLSISMTERTHWACLAAGGHGGRQIPFDDDQARLSRAILVELHRWRPNWIAVPAENQDRMVQSIRAAILSAVATLVADGREAPGVYQVQPMFPLPAGNDPTAVAARPGRQGDPISHAARVARQTRAANSEVVPNLGETIGSLSRTAQAFFQSTWVAESMPLDFSLVQPGSRPTGPKSPLAAGTAATRSPMNQLDTNSSRAARELEQLTRKRQLVSRLLSGAAKQPLDSPAWRAQIENLVAQMPQDAAATFLYELAHRQANVGQTKQGLLTMETLTRRFPNAIVAPAALRDALIWSCSAEVALRAQNELANSPAPAKPQPVVTPASTSQVDRQRPHFQFEDVVKVHPSRHGVETRNATIIESKHVPEFQVWQPSFWNTRLPPPLVAEPSIAFATEAHRRRQQRPGKRQQGIYDRLARRAPTSDWRACGVEELKILDPKRGSNKASMVCRHVNRPHLDGHLGDEAWQVAQPHTLDLGPSQAAVVWLARDQEYLYIACAAHCPTPLSAPPSGPRERDPNQDDFDRVEIAIDVDRDYATAWRLIVDERGCVGDRLDQDATWDPKWYVASKQFRPDNESLWTMEAAFPLSQLSAKTPNESGPWAVGIRRIDGTHSVSWPLSYDQRQPQTMGILNFE